MEEVNNPPHSMGSGQPHQHPVNHTRPFFYVQPPSQPYYMYQWHMNNPYGHYGFPGSGLPFGRPYMAPYPYMQYPGYVIPHAPVQPMDYRRMFNPHFPSAASYDVRFRHHYTRVRRETACSEAQTDPSDAVNKLIESLDKLRTCSVAPEKELDSGIVTQNSQTFLPGGDSKHEAQSTDLDTSPTKSSQEDVCLPPPSVAAFGNSAGTGGKPESSQSCFAEHSREEGWSVGSDGVLPLDSSSVQEESVALKEAEEGEDFGLHCVPEKLSLSSMRTDCHGSAEGNNQPVCGVKVPPESAQGPGTEQDREGPSKKTTAPSWPSPGPPPSQLASWLTREDTRVGVEQGVAEASKDPQGGSAKGKGDDGEDIPEKPAPDFEDLPYRILRLPCDKVTTAGMLQKDAPLWYVDSLSTLIPPHSYLSSFGNATAAAYYYSYYPPTTQERQSVLSPSIDELSSRDEMFSTDLEDMDLISGPVYTGGRLAEAPVRDLQEPSIEGNAKNASFHEECRSCHKMKMCTTCGSCLPKEMKRGKPHHPPGNYDYRAKEDTDEEAIEDEDEDDDDNNGKMLRATRETRKVPFKRPTHLKRPSQPMPPPIRPVPKQKSKRGYCEDLCDSACLEEQALKFSMAVDCCEEHKAMAKAEKYKGQEPRSAQSRSHQERASRRMTCKTFVCQRSRRTDCDDHEEGECPRFHRGRGSTKRKQKMQS